MRSKKGSVEIQFNWIFILIVGAVLLLFFYSIVRVQQKGSDTEIGYQTAVDLNTIFTAAIESTGTLNIIKIPETTIDFTCYEYYINNVNKPFNAKSVFAPDRLQGKNLMTWAVDWHAPYKVTNFLFITNSEVRYVIVRPTLTDKRAQDLIDLLPSGPGELFMDTVIEATPLVVDPKNEYKTRFVYFRPVTFNGIPAPPLPGSMAGLPGQSITAIVIAGSDINGAGRIFFYTKDGPNFVLAGDFPYIRHETVLAAVFSEDKEVYSCGVIKAFERMKIISEIYAERTVRIADDYNAIDDWCKSSFIATKAQTLHTWVKQMVDTPAYGVNDFNILNTDIKALEAQNREVIGASCARMY